MRRNAMDNKREKYQKLFTQQSVWRSIFSMAIPALLTIIIMIFYNMADTEQSFCRRHNLQYQQLDLLLHILWPVRP